MIRKKIIILVLGIMLILYLIMGLYLSSSMLSFTTEKFKEKCLWQTMYIKAELTPTLSPNSNAENLHKLEAILSKTHNMTVEIVTTEPKHSEEELRQAFTGHEGFRIINGVQGKKLLVAIPLAHNMVLRTTNSMAEVEAEEEKIRSSIVLVSCLLMFIAFFLLRHFIAKQTKPLEVTSASVRQYLSGQDSVRLPLNDNGEFGVLAFGFNTLADNYADIKIDLQREKHKNKIILNNMDNAMALINAAGHLVECNQQFTEWFGGSVGKENEEYENLLRHTKINEFLHQCLKEQDGTGIVFNIIKNNKKKVFKVFGAPMREAFQNYPTMVLMVFHDITAMQELYDKQTTFVSNASHELSTPLTTIRGFADTLLDEDTGSDAELRHKFLQIILEEAKRMQGLIKDLLQMAKLDQADYRESMLIENFAIEPILKDLAAEVQPQAEKRDLLFYVEEQDLVEPVLLYANKDWFKQILVNLTENALKYTPQKGKINISYAGGSEQVEFTVFNTGEGIGQEDRRKIFERFYRVDKARSRAQGGSGLGLSIVKFIVEILGGNIRVESEPGVGVSFIFTLPRGKNA